jgi:hypothetical protein
MGMRAFVGFSALSCFALGLMAVPQGASALDCSARPADAKTAWVYRTVEGKKCWYRGEKIISKAELHWPSAQASNEAGKDVGKPVGKQASKEISKEVRAARAYFIPVALPAATNDERHPVVLDSAGDTFEARWRGAPAR